MPVNKNALLRYRTLDRCFRNRGRKYYFDDLLNQVNDALADYDSTSSGIQTRQLRSDISFMKSEAGYSAPIEAIPDGRKSSYQYTDKTFSIDNSPMNKTEAEQLRYGIQILERFEGQPGFEWIRELTPLLKDKFGLSDEEKRVIGYDSNTEYAGLKWITPIFNAIVNERVLKVTYEPFDKKAFSLSFHPYYLKQYNNRWFAFGLNEELKAEAWNLALDRIASLEETDKAYENNTIDWEDYFFDVVGVTKPQGDPIEVKLVFGKGSANYVQTKPLHHTQKQIWLEDGSLEVRIKVILNYELKSLVRSFGPNVKVVEPKNLIE
jgi:predicted DNA-binding transcriptional regulator YafY